VQRRHDEQDAKFGYERYTGAEKRIGWLLNMNTTTTTDTKGITKSAVDYFFYEQDGGTFKATVNFSPYFLIGVKQGSHSNAEAYLRRRFEGKFSEIEIVEKEDLDLQNHLSGLKKNYIVMRFNGLTELYEIRREVQQMVRRNKLNAESNKMSMSTEGFEHADSNHLQNFEDFIVDVREFDVPYHMRASIDTDVRCGLWYTVHNLNNRTEIERFYELEARPEPRVMAWDIECTKMPLKFPDAENGDQVMMISYMLDRQGYLITNREIVSADIEDFEYTPKPIYPGEFKIFNEPNEKAVLQRFFEEIKTHKPNIYVTYNGDGFDWPFVETRALAHGIVMEQEIGVAKGPTENDGYMCRWAVNMDAFLWVKRDSYLPQGSQGLKAVTKYKLGYDPVELDPEEMTPFARDQPQTLASYSVSDAVATYYLYMKYVHPFIFSLANIIPMTPDEVLRKGSGGLCEALLMVEAAKVNVVFPNKQAQEPLKMYKGHLLDSETYIGGHVEALECGVYRSDLNYKFKVVPEAIQGLIDKIDRDLKFTLEVEGNIKLEDVENYEEVKAKIVEELTALRDEPVRDEKPLIYHLDVSAMYPNIILTNRLQPSAVVEAATCASCVYNPSHQPDKSKTCQRMMEWQWRGEYFPTSKSEFMHVKAQLESEPVEDQWGKVVRFNDLSDNHQATLIKARLKVMSQRGYKKAHVTKTELRDAIICQRENPFYVDTVKAFRDRRYVYKAKTKEWGGKLGAATKQGRGEDQKEAENMVILFDSLQLAHKCILNSFYGYVMRKGSRWFSMEMGGVVTHTGANIIQQARVLVEQIGRPLELDTDGIWCILPGSFPENFTFKVPSAKKGEYEISYPCVMLNADVHDNYTNHQYDTLTGADDKAVSFRTEDNNKRDLQTEEFKRHSECSIFFEVDGPYRAMILPAAREEGKLLKKRYAVFNDDGSLAELKGFELKRRGELQIIKFFQGQVFEKFLDGGSLKECYAAVGVVANRWLDVLWDKGADQDDDELMELITETKTMSKSLEDMGSAKSTAVCCARRLAEFLGDGMVKDSGLSCNFIISRFPEGEPVSNRAIPAAVFSTETPVKKHYLRKWCKNNSMTEADMDIRKLLDWDYYIVRLDAAIQKIITIPASLQHVDNPVPRSVQPEWVDRLAREKADSRKQRAITSMFTKVEKPVTMDLDDLEDFGTNPSKSPVAHRMGIPIVRKGGKNKSRRSASQGSGYGSGSESDGAGVGGRRRKKGANTLGLSDDEREEKEEEEAKAKAEQEKAKAEEEVTKKAKEAKEKEERLPTTRDEVPAWLALQKASWRKNIKEKAAGTYVRKSNNVADTFRAKTAQMQHKDWQVLHVAERDRQPGTFNLWVVLGEGDLQMVPLTVPRTIYINSRVKDARLEELDFVKKVNKELPHSHPSLHLYEVTLDEELFRARGFEKELTSYLTHPDIEGVYESKLSLEFQATVALGTACRVKKDRHIKDPLAGIHLSDLEAVPHQQGYLHGASGGDGWLRQVFVYYSMDGEKGICAALSMDLGVGTIVTINPNKGAMNPKPDRFFAAHELNITSHVANSRKDAFAILQKALTSYNARSKTPTLLCLQSPLSLKAMRMQIPALSDYPTIEMASNEKDSEYPQLGWQEYAAKALSQRIGSVEEWWTERLSLAEYAQIPLGNLGFDQASDISDVFFARKLRGENHLLWVSPSRHADLGGGASDQNQLLAEEISNPELTVPGAYRNICYEINLGGMAVNSLIKMANLDSLDGVEMGALLESSVEARIAEQNEDGESNQQLVPSVAAENERASCGQTLRVLKTLVGGWLQDLSKTDNEYADLLLVHLYRWLRNPAALLHDASLHRVIHSLMRRLFVQLVTELRSLGCEIVYASLNNIIISTGKTTPEQAEGYLAYTLDSLKSNDIFDFIEFDIRKSWQSLLFMDKANFGGITLDPETGASDIQANWNLADFLPVSLQNTFLTFVSQFIFYHFKGDEGTLPTEAEADGYVVPKELREHFTEKVLAVLETTKLGLDEEMETGGSGARGNRMDLDGEVAQEGDEDQNQPSPLALTKGADISPGVQFVNFFTHILSLDPRHQQETMLLRRNMLRMLQVREFDEEASFENPCVSFTLPDVICPFCNATKDLDLCRDPELLSKHWNCSECGHAYNKMQIETTLVEIAQQRATRYQLQDVRCMKCKMIKPDNISTCCSCSGEYTCVESSEELVESLETLHRIAKYHDFHWLEEVSEWLLDIQPEPEQEYESEEPIAI